MSKYKYFLKVIYSCGILEKNAEKEWKDDISCVLWNIFNDELGDSEYLSVCVGCNDAGNGVWVFETGERGIFEKGFAGVVDKCSGVCSGADRSGKYLFLES